MRNSVLSMKATRALLGACALTIVTAPAALCAEPQVISSLVPSAAGGETQTLTFVIDNMAGPVEVNGIGVFEELDDGLTIAQPANATTNCIGGFLDARPGATTFEYSGGMVPAATACTVRVDVTSAPVDTASLEAGAPADEAGPLALGFGVADEQTTTTEQDEAAQSTTAAGEQFMEARREELAARDADLTDQRNNRLSNDGKPIRLRGSTDGNRRELSVTTSLRRLISGAGAPFGYRYSYSELGSGAPRRDLSSDSGGGRGAGGGTGFDVWVRGIYTSAENGERDRQNAVAHLGTDYRFTPGLAVGVMQQVDVTDDENPVPGATAEGWGWMVGPYMVARLPQNLLFDARAAWGESYNSVVAAPGVRNRFNAVRMLVRGQLTGETRYGGILIRPYARVVYLEETANGHGAPGADGTGVHARAEGGYNMSYVVRLEDGTTIEPRLGMSGSTSYDLAAIAEGRSYGGTGDLRARIEAAVKLQTQLGWSLDAGGYYGGIGALDTRHYGGEVKFSVPLN